MAVEEPQLERYMDVVRQVACSLQRHLRSDAVDREDLEADGFEALVRAVRDHDSSKGPLIPYIVLRCRGAMIDGLRQKMLTSRRDRAQGVEEPVLLSLDDKLDEGLRVEDLLADPDATTADEVIERVSATALGGELTALPKRYQRILRARFVLGRSQQDVASAEGVSPGRIAQIEAGIRCRLQPVAEIAEEPLTTRELKVLRFAAEGASTDETARRLRKACETVKGHRHAIIAKLQARNMVNAVAIGYRRGLLH